MSEVLYCPACWNPVPADALLCPHCGKALSSQAMQHQQEVAAKVNIEGRRRGGCCAAVVVIALLLIFFSLLRGFFFA